MNAPAYLVLLENLFDAAQYRHLIATAAQCDVRLEYASNLWGYDSLLFSGDDVHCSVEVNRDVSALSLEDYAGLILLGGYAMDRLRFQPAPLCGQPNRAPAVEFLRRAVARMDSTPFRIATIGHGLQLFCAAPELLQGRHVTCGHNIIQEVVNAGGIVIFDGNRTADSHVQGNLWSARDTAVAASFFLRFFTPQ